MAITPLAKLKPASQHNLVRRNTLQVAAELSYSPIPRITDEVEVIGYQNISDELAGPGFIQRAQYM